ncbi:Fasciclin-1 [Halotydeus destructor]|nr:Fasciclin-1 [Halotydeus destructor]
MASSKVCMTLVLVVCSVINCVVSETVLDAINADANLSKFREVLDRDAISKIMLASRTATVFAFTNDAYEKASETFRDTKFVAPLHIVGRVLSKDQFPLTSLTLLQQSPRVVLTTKSNVSSDDRLSNSLAHSHSGQKEYFVNNAKIISEKRGFKSVDGDDQVLFVIDEVLEPFIPDGGNPPNAKQFIQKEITYKGSAITSKYDVFASLIGRHKLGDLFSMEGNHTFFVPLVGDNDKSLLKNLDEVVVRAHVVPNQALYLRTLEPMTEYKTGTWDDDNQVVISLPMPPELRPTTNRIQSNTQKVAGTHHVGLVRTNVMRANIPVSNGVVHLIEKPLMIVDISIWDFIENNRDGQISKFAQLVQKTDTVLTKLRNANRDLTIFAPNNHAFDQLGEEKFSQLLNDPKMCEELAGLHMVEGTVSTEDVRTGKTLDSLSLDGKRSLYFQIAQSAYSSKVLTVEGGGVNATVIQADIGATNGVIHILDKVLGIPFQTVFEKLKDDFDLSTTYTVGSHRGDYWNRKLADMTKKFTYFAPSKAAWADLKVHMPSEYKQLTEGILPVHGEQILERLLLVQTDQVLSSDQLSSKVGQSIRTVRGELKVGKTDKGEITLSWEGLEAKVTRPDVHAINGVIHVIDKVLMKKRDMTTSGALSASVGSLTALTLSLVVAFRL